MDCKDPLAVARQAQTAISRTADDAVAECKRLRDRVKALEEGIQRLLKAEWMVSPAWSGSGVRDKELEEVRALLSESAPTERERLEREVIVWAGNRMKAQDALRNPGSRDERERTHLFVLLDQADRKMCDALRALEGKP